MQLVYMMFMTHHWQ